MDKDLFIQILDKYLKGEASPQERALIEEYYKRLNEKHTTLLSKDEEEDLQAELLKTIQGRLSEPPQSSKPPIVKIERLWRPLVAASVIFLIGMLIYNGRYSNNASNQVATNNSTIRNFIPGNKAILTLANGAKISLTDAADGEVARQSGISITKTKSGNIVYASASDKIPKNPAAVFNTIATPRGGEYQIRLPDGTKVWLNAATSLTYPVQFTGNERRVTLNGEAYFEVAHDRTRPFKVFTQNQEVEVLGTHFNINSYDDESATRTTLLEGSVKVSKLNTVTGVVLKPGQLSVLNANSLKVEAADVESELDWKNGYFIFNEESLSTIMKKVSRWYDVDVIYDQHASNSAQRFGGIVSRSKKITDVLKTMERTGEVHFKTDGRKVIVLP